MKETEADGWTGVWSCECGQYRRAVSISELSVSASCQYLANPHILIGAEVTECLLTGTGEGESCVFGGLWNRSISISHHRAGIRSTMTRHVTPPSPSLHLFSTNLSLPPLLQPNPIFITLSAFSPSNLSLLSFLHYSLPPSSPPCPSPSSSSPVTQLFKRIPHSPVYSNSSVDSSRYIPLHYMSFS